MLRSDLIGQGAIGGFGVASVIECTQSIIDDEIGAVSRIVNTINTLEDAKALMYVMCGISSDCESDSKHVFVCAVQVLTRQHSL